MDVFAISFGLLSLFFETTLGNPKSLSFKSAWVPEESWTETWKLERSTSMGSRDPQTCSLDCLLANWDGELQNCQAFTIENGSCRFGSVAYGLILPATAAVAKKQIWYNEEFYSREEDTRVYTVGDISQESDPIDTTRTEAPLTLPHPHGVRFDVLPIVVNFRKSGLLTVGGMGDDLTSTKSWFPGDLSWKSEKSCGYLHLFGAGVALDGGNAVLVAGGFDDDGKIMSAKAELFGSDGSWRPLSDYPEPVYRLTLVGRGDNKVVYGFGGFGEISKDSSHVYRYTMADDVWTAVPDMLHHSGEGPNCGKVEFRGRESVICMGTRTSDEGHMDVFDMYLETWQTLNSIRAPDPVTSSSLMFSLGHRLFRVRGRLFEGGTTHTLSVFDAETEVWEENVQLKNYAVAFEKLAKLTVPVIVPKNV